MKLYGQQIRWDVKPAIDLRYEVAAAPTPEMWEAMRKTNIGMASIGEDAAVRELEALGAELTGHEAALLVPTTTVGTLLCMMSVAARGTVVMMEERCHIYWVEHMHLSYICGAVPQLLRGNKFGAIPLDLIEASINRQYYGITPPTSMLCLENTHNICGGTVLSPEYTRSAVALCHRYGVKVHLDGARVINAAIALRVPVSELTASVDFVVFSLNKGLAAPFGGLLCGSRDFIEEAKLNSKRLGTLAIHKAGIFASAGLVALRTMMDRLAEDHRRARLLAEGISSIPGLNVDLDTVQTNLVRVDTTPSRVGSFEVASALAKEGIAVHILETDALKFATHLEISDDDIQRAIAATRSVMLQLREKVGTS